MILEAIFVSSNRGEHEEAGRCRSTSGTPDGFSLRKPAILVNTTEVYMKLTQYATWESSPSREVT